MVTTVLGPIASDQLGVTLAHEHLVLDGWEPDSPNYLNSISMEVEEYVSLGGSTIVELSTGHRNLELLRAISNRTGLQIVVGTGSLVDDSTEEADREFADDLDSGIIASLIDGIDGTDTRAGLIGGVAIRSPIDPTGERILAASARAQLATGVAIAVVFDVDHPIGERLRVVDTLIEWSVDPSKILVCGLRARSDNYELVAELAARGCFVAFDRLGSPLRVGEWLDSAGSADVEAASIVGFADAGFLDHIVLSHGVSGVDQMSVNGGSGYAFLLETVVPLLVEHGLSQREIDTMTQLNPRALLANAPD